MNTDQEDSNRHFANRTRQYQIRLNKYDRAPELVKCWIKDSNKQTRF